MTAVIVPDFERHANSVAYLSRRSWEEIFGSVESQVRNNSPYKLYRKIRQVRIAKKDGLYCPLASIRGLYNSPNMLFRRVYGEVLFHTTHSREKNVPYQCQTQLAVSCNGVIHAGQVASVMVYILPRTRFSRTLYRQLKGECFQEAGEMEVSRSEDYAHGLLRTNKVVCEWNYCIPPLKE